MPITTPVNRDSVIAAQLRTRLRGEVITAQDADWDAARTPWALNIDQRPVAVARPVDAEDVRTCVQIAAAADIHVTAQATGHQAAPMGDLGNTLLVRTDCLREVRIDPESMIARVGSGALWADVTEAAGEHGLAALAGSAADVGVVGYTLGGGVGWLARSHGLAANSVTAIEAVTADGTLRRIDSTHNADLFWALRGGGGSFAIVTAIEFRLYPIADVFAGALFWPATDAARVLRAWHEWTRALPASVTSAARVLNFPPLPDLPPHLSGRSFVVIEAAFQEPTFVARAYLAELHALAPEFDSFARIPAASLSALHMDPPGPVPCTGDGAMLHALTRETIDEFAAAAVHGPARALMSAEFRHIGAALAPSRGEGGAVSSLDGEYLVYAVGVTPTPEATDAVLVGIAAIMRAIEPCRTRTGYANFAERPVSPHYLFGEAATRLAEIKRAVDPDDVIRATHNAIAE